MARAMGVGDVTEEPRRGVRTAVSSAPTGAMPRCWRNPTAYAVGYTLSPLSGLREGFRQPPSPGQGTACRTRTRAEWRRSLDNAPNARQLLRAPGYDRDESTTGHNSAAMVFRTTLRGAGSTPCGLNGR